MRNPWKQFLAWVFPPPQPEVSDVESVVLVRKVKNGTYIRLSLTGDDASRWGYLLAHANPTDLRYTELLPKWKREEMNK